MSSSESSTQAFALGAASGLRTFGALGPLGARGRLAGKIGRYAFPALLAGELAGDKHPAIPARSDPPAVAGRLAAGAVAGRTVAGLTGAGLGAAGAAATTYLSQSARAALGERFSVPDPVLGTAEDMIAIAIATVASADDGSRGDGAAKRSGIPVGDELAADADTPDLSAEPGPAAGAAAPEADAEAPGADGASSPSPAAACARGLLACAIGTAAMTTAQNAYQKATGTSPSDAPAQVGRRILRETAGRRVPRRHRSALNQGMHFLYGAAWGAPFGLLVRDRPVWPTAGLALGAAVWAVSLGELPALGLAPAPWQRSPASLASEFAFHLVYGAGAAAAYEAMGS